MQIVVLGMHRSGTSATAGLLVQLGAYFGPAGIALPSAEDNARGFWERRDVVEANDALLAATGSTWHTPHRYAPDHVPAASRDAFDTTAKSVARELAAQPLSLIKDPRMCITFDAWRNHFSRPFILLVVRHPLSSARSFERRADGSIEAGLALWEFYMRAAVAATRGLPYAVANYDELVADPENAGRALIERMNAAAGTRLLRDPVAGECSRFIEPNLRHHRDSEDALAAVASADVIELYRLLRERPLNEIPAIGNSSATRWALRLHEREVTVRTLKKERDELKAALQVCTPAIAAAESALRQVALRTELHAALVASRTVRGSGPTLPDVHRMLDHLGAARDTAARLLPK